MPSNKPGKTVGGIHIPDETELKMLDDIIKQIMLSSQQRIEEEAADNLRMQEEKKYKTRW